MRLWDKEKEGDNRRTSGNAFQKKKDGGPWNFIKKAPNGGKPFKKRSGETRRKRVKD